MLGLRRYWGTVDSGAWMTAKNQQISSWGVLYHAMTGEAGLSDPTWQVGATIQPPD